MRLEPGNSVMLAALLFFFTPAIAAERGREDESQNGVLPCNEYCQEKLALSGDRKAAMSCADYHIHDVKLRRYWQQIAAENGDPIGQYNFAMELFSEKKAAERARAIFWLEKSASQGDEYAEEVLADIRLNPDMAVPPAPPKP